MLIELRESRERERRDNMRLSFLRNTEIHEQKMHNYKNKEGRRLNLSLVN